MKLHDARKLRDYIRSVGVGAVTPMKGCAPDKFFARIYGINGEQDFHSMKEWKKYEGPMLKRNEERSRLGEVVEACGGWQGYLEMKRRRSPIEIMVDRACGLP